MWLEAGTRHDARPYIRPTSKFDIHLHNISVTVILEQSHITIPRASLKQSYRPSVAANPPERSDTSRVTKLVGLRRSIDQT